jgi:hypothetical protein
MNAINRAYTTKESRDHITSSSARNRFLQWNKDMKEAGAKLTTFGGKRLLGMTKSGTLVWASYTIDKETKNIQIKLTHKIETLLQEGSVLAPRRTTVGAKRTVPGNPMRPKSKLDVGEITENSLRYLAKLIDIAESPTIGKVKGECSTQLFMLVSNFLYEGGTEPTEPRWRDVMDTWDLPSGAYLTVYG